MTFEELQLCLSPCLSFLILHIVLPYLIPIPAMPEPSRIVLEPGPMRDPYLTSILEKPSRWAIPQTTKTDIERSISQLGTVVEPYDVSESIERDRELLLRGPTGPPVYDRLGYQLDYKVVACSCRRPRRRDAPKWTRAVAKSLAETDKKRRFMGARDSGRSPWFGAWGDRVARDLDIPHHTVHLLAFEEWYRRGLRCQEGEWEKPVSPEERNRLNVLGTGSALGSG